MSQRGDVSPRTLSVSVDEESIGVEYLDGRRVTYRGAPTEKEETIRCRPGKHVHLLVTDQSSSEGVMVYVNDRKTSDDILASTGVGRVVLEPGEQAEVVPGVTIRQDGYAVEVDADPATVGGRVFVFEEDETGERSFEAVEG